MRAYFARHAQTLIGSLGRLVAQPFGSAMTMGVIGIAIALPLLGSLLLQNARLATSNLNTAFDLTVYLEKKSGSARTQQLAKQLLLRGDVAQVRIISADEAFAAFRNDSGFGKALDALADNPLPDTLVVTPTLDASTPRGTETLKSAIGAMPDVQAAQLDTEWVKRLNAMLDVLKRVVLLTGALLALGIVLIVSNTVRLDILNRRAEIEVMKLVGASDGFTRRPFLYSGLWYGLGGGALALLFSAAAGAVLAQPVEQLATLYGSGFRLQGLGFLTAASVLGVAAFLAWAGSWIAAQRHIREIEPA